MSMVATGTRPGGAGAVTLRRRLLGGLALVLALGTLLYGVLAIDAGLSNWAASGNRALTAERQALMAGAEDAAQGQERATSEEAARLRYRTLEILARFAPERYVYGRDGLMETLIHYGEMPRLNAAVLATHNTLAGLCMLFAAFQFWPRLRRLAPAWHRRFGMLYVGGIQTAMLAAMTYLLLTPVAHIYDQMTFAWMLWFLALGVTASLWMAMAQLWRGNIAQHMGYLTLNFGLLLTAPVLRGGWLVMGMVNPAARQIESNFAINGILIPASFLIGYALFVINRMMQPTRAQAPLLTQVRPWPLAVRGLILLLAIVAFWTMLRYGLLRPGIAALGLPEQTVPAGVLALDASVYVDQPLMRWLFTGAVLGGIALATRALMRRASGQHGSAWLQGADRWGLVVFAAVAGVVQLGWAEAMGLPSFATLTGGGTALFGGMVTLGFAALLALAAQRDWDDWADEWGAFALACLLATPVYALVQPWFGGLDVHPAFREAGHLFRLAGIAQWLVLLVPFLFAIHGRATRRRLAR